MNRNCKASLEIRAYDVSFQSKSGLHLKDGGRFLIEHLLGVEIFL